MSKKALPRTRPARADRSNSQARHRTKQTTGGRAANQPASPHLTVLITQNHFAQYQGSEMVTLELAEYFSAAGYRVIVGANHFGEPMSRELGKLPGAEVYGINDPKLEAAVRGGRLALVWVHHQLLPEFFLRDMARYRDVPVIYHHMSAYHPFEFPFLYRVERAAAGLVLYNSPETKEAIEEKLGVPFSQSGVLHNPAPDAFLAGPAAGSRSEPGPVRRVAVVSNHVPPEIREAAGLLRQQGISVEMFGYSDQPRRVTPEILDGYDAVVTIGKTVQYSILRGIPVYCYDHFGGPGFLDADNFERAMHYNFSGRGFNKKTPQQVAKEIAGFQVLAQPYKFIGQDALDKLTLSKQMAAVLASVEGKTGTAAEPGGQLSAQDIAAAVEVLGAIRTLSAEYAYLQALRALEQTAHDTETRQLRQHNDELAGQLAATAGELAGLRARHDALRAKLQKIYRIPGVRLAMRGYRAAKKLTRRTRP